MYQHYAYVLTELTSDGVRHDGVYPNFKLAYERLEDIANGKQIISIGDNDFEVISIQRDARNHEYYGHISVSKYSITRKLMTIRNADELVTVDMVDNAIKTNKRIGN